MGIPPIPPEKLRSPSFAGLSPSSEASSRAKRANRKKDTKHELLLQRELWRRGVRYRKYVVGLPGNPDLVFHGDRVVVFCDGDFWHGRHWRRLRSQLSRRHNAAYWIEKIATNRKRDRATTRRLEEAGWIVLRLWETDILRDLASAVQKILDAVHPRSAISKALGP